jgi:3-oxoacyl-[acyl-carrier protein] reductase
MDIKGSKIIITGGAGGIGRHVVLNMLKGSADVTVIDCSDDNIDSLIDEVSKNNFKGRLNTIKMNVSDRCKIMEYFELHSDSLESHDVLINCVAVLVDKPLIYFESGSIKTFDDKEWDSIISQNLTSYFLFSSLFAKNCFNARKNGVIVNVSSLSSSGNIGQSAYSATKSAINSLTVTWCRELAPLGIRVAGVSPGLTDTSMPRSSLPHNKITELINSTPVRRIGKPEEIAQAIMFVISNDFICGRTIDIDGGLVFST